MAEWEQSYRTLSDRERVALWRQREAAKQAADARKAHIAARRRRIERRIAERSDGPFQLSLFGE